MEMSFFNERINHADPSATSGSSASTNAPSSPTSNGTNTTAINISQQSWINLANQTGTGISDIAAYLNGSKKFTIDATKVRAIEDWVGKNIPIATFWVNLAHMTGTGLSDIMNALGPSKGDKLGAAMRDQLGKQLSSLGFAPEQVAFMDNTGLPSRDALSDPNFVKLSMYDMVYKALKEFPNTFSVQQTLILRDIAKNSLMYARPVLDEQPFNDYFPSDLPEFIEAQNLLKSAKVPFKPQILRDFYLKLHPQFLPIPVPAHRAPPDKEPWNNYIAPEYVVRRDESNNIIETPLAPIINKSALNKELRTGTIVSKAPITIA